MLANLRRSDMFHFSDLKTAVSCLEITVSFIKMIPSAEMALFNFFFFFLPPVVGYELFVNHFTPSFCVKFTSRHRRRHKVFRIKALFLFFQQNFIGYIYKKQHYFQT